MQLMLLITSHAIANARLDLRTSSDRDLGGNYKEQGARLDRVHTSAMIGILNGLLTTPPPNISRPRENFKYTKVSTETTVSVDGVDFKVLLRLETRFTTFDSTGRRQLVAYLDSLLGNLATTVNETVGREELPDWFPEHANNVTLLHVPREDPDVIQRAIAAGGNHDSPSGHTHGSVRQGGNADGTFEDYESNSEFVRSGWGDWGRT